MCECVGCLGGPAGRSRTACARNKTPPGEEPPWAARNYVPYWSQILSKEVQLGAAEEILSRVREETGARQAARARGE